MTLILNTDSEGYGSRIYDARFSFLIERVSQSPVNKSDNLIFWLLNILPKSRGWHLLIFEKSHQYIGGEGVGFIH